MTRVQLHQPAICLTLVLFLIAGCGGDSDTVRPQPGATFIGPLELSLSDGNATASEGELELTITADGAAIASSGYSLLNTKCSNDAGTITIESGGWATTLTPAQPVAIANGKFEFNVGDLKISGQFTAPTEATATVEISTEESVGAGSSITCDFGSWNWNGKVK